MSTTLEQPVAESKEPVAATEQASAPTVEQYNAVKNKLTLHILHKQDLSAKLASLEESIYNMECDYFNESAYGNIVKGFEFFSKTSGGLLGGLSSSNKRRHQYSHEDHIFSLSSASFAKTLMRRQSASASRSNGVSVSTSKDDWEEYEDSVEPSTAKPSEPSGVATTNADPSVHPRKRKPRVLDD